MTIPIRKITTTPPIRRPSSRLGVAATTTTRTDSENTTTQGRTRGASTRFPITIGMTSVVSGTTGTSYCATPISTDAATSSRAATRSDSRSRRTARFQRRVSTRPADRPVGRPGCEAATIGPTLVVGGTPRPRFANPGRTAHSGEPHLRPHRAARDRKRGWQRGHQNRLRPTSTSVRTVLPHTKHASPARR